MAAVHGDDLVSSYHGFVSDGKLKVRMRERRREGRGGERRERER